MIEDNRTREEIEEAAREIEEAPVEWHSSPEEAIAAAPGPVAQLMAAYLDPGDAPRAWAYGPVEAVEDLKAVASANLDAYLNSYPAYSGRDSYRLGWVWLKAGE